MKKGLTAIVLVLVMVIRLGISASAAEARADTVTPQLSFNGTTAECEVTITSLGKSITATLELWQGSTLLESWDGAATTRLVINESCTVTKGKTYTLKVNGTIGGEAFEGTPFSATCN